MASATLDLYKDNSSHEVFTLASQNSAGAKWLLPGRSLATPKSVEIARKINSTSVSNDTVNLKLSQTELNATTGKPATFFIDGKISIPKDVTVITPTVQKALIAQFVSLLNDATALAATSVNRTALIEGRDI